MNTTTTNNLIPALAKAVRPFAHKGSRGPIALRDALVVCDGASTSVTATNMEIVATITVAGDHAAFIATEATDYLVDAATGVPVGDTRDVREFPAVNGAKLDGEFRCRLELAWADVKRIAEHLVPATDNETSRYALGGVLLERDATGPLVTVATDGRRMHAARFSLADGYGEIQKNAVAPATLFPAFVSAARAAARAVLGAKGVDAAMRAGVTTMQVTDVNVGLSWVDASGMVRVSAAARLIEGRFPRWRDILEQTGANAPGGQVSILDASATAAACREAVTATKAAAGPARAAWVAERVARGFRSTKPGEYRHPAGVEFSLGGMVCMGCDYHAPIATGRPIRLDPAFVAEAVEAAAAFGGKGSVEMTIVDDTSAVTITAGSWAAGGPGLFAVIMPMVRE